jgi:hypothetical protein
VHEKNVDAQVLYEDGNAYGKPVVRLVDEMTGAQPHVLADRAEREFNAISAPTGAATL